MKYILTIFIVILSLLFNGCVNNEKRINVGNNAKSEADYHPIKVDKIEKKIVIDNRTDIYSIEPVKNSIIQVKVGKCNVRDHNGIIVMVKNKNDIFNVRGTSGNMYRIENDLFIHRSCVKEIRSDAIAD